MSGHARLRRLSDTERLRYRSVQAVRAPAGLQVR